MGRCAPWLSPAQTVEPSYQPCADLADILCIKKQPAALKSYEQAAAAATAAAAARILQHAAASGLPQSMHIAPLLSVHHLHPLYSVSSTTESVPLTSKLLAHILGCHASTCECVSRSPRAPWFQVFDVVM